MVFSSLGGLKSCAVGGGRIESEEVHEEVRALLDDNLLSPTHSSGQNSPLTGPPQTLFDAARKQHNIKQPKRTIKKGQLSSEKEKNKWETIETTVTYDNGSKETILGPNVEEIETFNDDESCPERCWECIETMVFRLFCCNASFKTAEVYRNMQNVFTRVDHIASRVFPMTFMIMNITYWALYIYIL